MSNIILSLNVMLPVFLTIMLGIILRKINLLPQTIVKDLNNLCFKVFLPIMLFNNVRRTHFSEVFDPALISYAVACVFVIFIALWFIVPLLVKEPGQQSVVIQGWYRSNYVIFGVPIVASIYGAHRVALITMLIAFIVPLFNLLAVILFEKFNRGGIHHLGKLVLNIFSNPLIIATLIGLAFSSFSIYVPVFVDKTLTDLGNVTLPLALLILGADLDLNWQHINVKLLCATVLGRTLIIPLIFLPLSIMLGFRGESLASLMVLFASPAAVSGYIMAQNAKADHQLAGQVIVFTSLVSCFTIFVFIAVLKHFALI